MRISSGMRLGPYEILAPLGVDGMGQTGGRDTLNLLGLSELCLGRGEEARRYLERSLSLDPAQPPIREALRMMAVGGPGRPES